jgi:hypothetical protein
LHEIEPDQIWTDGTDQTRVTNAFGVRILIRRNGAEADEEIAEDDFRRRFKFVS